jgi:hypothetical protein
MKYYKARIELTETRNFQEVFTETVEMEGANKTALVKEAKDFVKEWFGDCKSGKATTLITDEQDNIVAERKFNRK